MKSVLQARGFRRGTPSLPANVEGDQIILYWIRGLLFSHYKDRHQEMLSRKWNTHNWCPGALTACFF